MSLRLQRVRELLKREIGEVIRRELPVEQAGVITVNDVKVSADLHSATVFVGILGSAEQVKNGLSLLRVNRIKIQNQMARAVVLKYTPQLRFLMDDSAGRGGRVQLILDELEATNPHVPEPSEEDPEHE